MPLKHWIDRQLVALARRQQAICRLVRPVDAQRRCVWYEPVLKCIVLVVGNELIAHLGPRQVLDPGWVWGKELGGAGGHPLGNALVVVLCGVDLPAEYEEHYVENGNFLRELRDVWEVGDDVGDYLGQRVGMGVGGIRAPFFRVEERGDRRVGLANELPAGDAVGSFSPARLYEVEEN